MIKATIQLLVIAVSIAIFVMFTKVQNSDRQKFVLAGKDLDTAITNYKDYSQKKDSIIAQKNSIDPESIAKLEKLLPKNVENMKLILDITKIGSDNKIVIRNIKFDSDSIKEASVLTQEQDPNTPNKPYNSFNIQFSSEGRYSDFVAFVTQLEKNQRIIDVETISFSAPEVYSLTTPADYYKYDVSINTYWLGTE